MGNHRGLSLSVRIFREQLSVSTYQWLELVPQGSVTLLAGGKYWLVIERSGIDLQNGYWIGLDENLGFETGQCFYIMEAAGLGEARTRICFFGSWVERLWRGRSVIWSSLRDSS